MKFLTAQKIRNILATRLYETFENAIRTKPSYKELNDKILKIIYNSAPKTTPSWVRYYLNGIVDSETRRLKQNLEFCYTLDDGKLYSIRDESNRYYEKHNITHKDLYEREVSKALYWIDTDKPY